MIFFAESRLFSFSFVQYVCHAELNAILNKNSAEVRYCQVSNVDICLFEDFHFINQIYVALFPCNECAKVIIQTGIVEGAFVLTVFPKFHGFMIVFQ